MAKKVLVVEDHTDVRRMMKILLEVYGYQVIEASDGYEAVEKAVEEKPDMVFMDIAMPVLDGIKSTRAMRQHEHLANVPIVAVTAYGDFYNERAIAAGCTEVLQKPLNFGQLKPMMQQYLN